MIMDPRYADLVRRAKRSELSREEIDAVAEELRHPLPHTDPYYLLAILGEAGGVWHRELVERFLEAGNNPWLARKALQVLCADWGDTDRYLDELAQFLAGAPWDTDDDVRLVAMTWAGEYLRDHREPRLLRELLRIFDDQGERELLRRTAYDSLARATGRPWSATSVSREQPPVDRMVIEEARQRLVTRGG